MNDSFDFSDLSFSPVIDDDHNAFGEAIDDNEVVKDFKCLRCNQSFPSRSSRDAHGRTHTIEKTANWKRRRESERVETLIKNQETNLFTCFCGSRIKNLEKHASICRHMFDDEYEDPGGMIKRRRLNDLPARVPSHYLQLPEIFRVEGQVISTALSSVIVFNHNARLYCCRVCVEVISTFKQVQCHVAKKEHTDKLPLYGIKALEKADRELSLRESFIADGEFDIIDNTTPIAGIPWTSGYQCTVCDSYSVSKQSMGKRHRTLDHSAEIRECRFQKIRREENFYDYRCEPPAEDNRLDFVAAPHSNLVPIIQQWGRSSGDNALPICTYYNLSSLPAVIKSGLFETMMQLVAEDFSNDSIFRGIPAIALRFAKAINSAIPVVSNTFRGVLGYGLNDDESHFMRRLTADESLVTYSKYLAKLLCFLLRLVSAQEREDLDDLELNCFQRGDITLLDIPLVNDFRNALTEFFSEDGAGVLTEDSVTNAISIAQEVDLHDSLRGVFVSLETLMLHLVQGNFNATSNNSECVLWVFVCFTQVKTIGGGLHAIGDITQKIAKLQYFMKGCVLIAAKFQREDWFAEIHHEAYIGYLGSSQKYSAFNILVDEFNKAKRYKDFELLPLVSPQMVNGKPSPDAFIHLKRGSLVTKEILVTKTKRLLSICIKAVKELTFGYNLRHKWLESYYDDPSYNTAGIAWKNDHLAAKVVNSLRSRCLISTNTQHQVKLKYLNDTQSLLENILLLMHITSFACSRGTELASFQLDNTSNIQRNVFIRNGTVLVCPTYNKNGSLTNSDIKTPRFYPIGVALLIVNYAILLRPAIAFARDALELMDSRSPMLFVHPSTNEPYKSSQLRASFQRLLGEHYSLDLAFGDFRQIHAAMIESVLMYNGHSNSMMTMASFAANTEANNIFLAEASGHSIITATTNYARSTDNIRGVDRGHLWKSGIFSLAWIKYLELDVIDCDEAPALLIEAAADASLLPLVQLVTSKGNTQRESLPPRCTPVIETRGTITSEASPPPDVETLIDPSSVPSRYDECIITLLTNSFGFTTWRNEAQKYFLRLIYANYAEKEFKDICYVLPTNSGKTTAVFMLTGLNPTRKVIYIAPLNALLQNISQRATAFGIQSIIATHATDSTSLNSASLILTSTEYAATDSFRGAFRTWSASMDVVAVFVDEAHLLLLWQSFRQSIMDFMSTVKEGKAPIYFLSGSLPPSMTPYLLSAVNLNMATLRFPTVRSDICLLRVPIAVVDKPVDDERSELNYMTQCLAESLAVTIRRIKALKMDVHSDSGNTKVLVFVSKTSDANYFASLLPDIESVVYTSEHTENLGRVEHLLNVYHGFVVIVATTALSTGVDYGLDYVFTLGPLDDMSHIVQCMGRVGRRQQYSEMKSKLFFVIWNNTAFNEMKFNNWSRSADSRSYFDSDRGIKKVRAFLSSSDICAMNLISQYCDGNNEITCFGLASSYCDYCFMRASVRGLCSSRLDCVAKYLYSLVYSSLPVVTSPLRDGNSVSSYPLNEFSDAECEEIMQRIDHQASINLRYASQREPVKDMMRQLSRKCTGCFIKTGELKDKHGYTNRCLNFTGCFECSLQNPNHSASNCPYRLVARGGSKWIRENITGFCTRCSLPATVSGFQFHDNTNFSQCPRQLELSLLVYYCYLRSPHLRSLFVSTFPQLPPYNAVSDSNVDLTSLQRFLLQRDSSSQLLNFTNVCFVLFDLLKRFKGLANIIPMVVPLNE
jgi:superfamily II DNA helicase RecQ